ncbi:hypothetical protein SRB5_43810 [Streptomyces sp. RB5]|uniref:Uncharacterized protein n=1 Tax=Streptomyces smaragdinus TaxID=2585196 RepID=A0A7K0CL56_9ACTN|nr:hypothetical protein [Streptomyces smaragdinus]MQY14219.1 hypothetical protein [Streptomyces smaragdinus]
MIDLERAMTAADHARRQRAEGPLAGPAALLLAALAMTVALLSLDAPQLRDDTSLAGSGGWKVFMAAVVGIVVAGNGLIGVRSADVVDRPGLLAGQLSYCLPALAALSFLDYVQYGEKLLVLHFLRTAVVIQLLVCLVYWCRLAQPAVRHWVRAGTGLGLVLTLPCLALASPQEVAGPLWQHPGPVLALVLVTGAAGPLLTRTGIAHIAPGQAWHDAPKLASGLLLGAGLALVGAAVAEAPVHPEGGSVHPAYATAGVLLVLAVATLGVRARRTVPDPRQGPLGTAAVGAGLVGVAVFTGLGGREWAVGPMRDVLAADPWRILGPPLLGLLLALAAAAFLPRWAPMSAGAAALVATLMRYRDMSSGEWGAAEFDVSAMLLSYAVLVLLFTLRADVTWAMLGIQMAAAVVTESVLFPLAERLHGISPKEPWTAGAPVFLAHAACALLATLLLLPRRRRTA